MAWYISSGVGSGRSSMIPQWFSAESEHAGKLADPRGCLDRKVDSELRTALPAATKSLAGSLEHSPHRAETDDQSGRDHPDEAVRHEQSIGLPGGTEEREDAGL